MARFSDSASSYLTRSGSFLNEDISWTWTDWFNYYSIPADGQFITFKIWGDPAFTNPYIWLGATTIGGVTSFVLEVFDGVLYHTTTPTVIVPTVAWNGIGVVYDSTANTLKLYKTNNLTSAMTLIDTLSVNLSTIAFVEKIERLVGSGDVNELFLVSVGFDRVFQSVLTAAQIRTELSAQAAVLVDLADVPFILNSNDISGNGRNYTNVNDIFPESFISALVQVAYGMGQSIRECAQYLPSEAANNLVLYGAINGSQLVTNFGIIGFSVIGLGLPPPTPLIGSVTFRFTYYGNGAEVNVDITDPWPDAITGYIYTGAPVFLIRDAWGWHNIEIRVKTSTYDGAALTYAQDGAVELKLDGVVVYTQTNIYIKRTPQNPNFTFLTCETYPTGDSDALWITNAYVYPTYTGVQRVPTSVSLLAYLNFNSGAPGAPWNNDNIGPGIAGPVFNSIAGLEASGSASLWDSDPLIEDGTSITTYRPSGSLRNSVLILSPFVTPPPPSSTGSILVTKITINATDDYTDFDIVGAGTGITPTNFTLAHNEQQLFTGLTPGSGYSIIETPNADYITTYQVSNGINTAITVVANVTTSVVITNTRKGRLTVGKVTDIFNATQVFDFTASGGLSPATFNLLSEEEQVFSGLTPGIYTLVETALVEWSPVYLIENDPLNNNLAITITPGCDFAIMVLNNFASEGDGLYYIHPPVWDHDELLEQNGTITDVQIPNPHVITGFVRDL